jgi:hypothetical protein
VDISDLVFKINLEVRLDLLRLIEIVVTYVVFVELLLLTVLIFLLMHLLN